MPERRAVLRWITDPRTGDKIDHVLSLFFAGPATVTGEDIVEWHCHGGQAVVSALLSLLGQQQGLRAARAGEFTQRAFDNGKIDLNEAEGLADLLSAETEDQRRAALAMAEGHFSRKVEGWRGAVLGLAAMVEAELDFGDEDDVAAGGHPLDQVRAGLYPLVTDIRAELSRPDAQRLRDGIRVVIAGPPNAGKSTLLNALAGRDAAIVSDVAGTTRDRIEVPVAIGGTAFVLTDTAGLRDAGQDAIEMIGMDRARLAMDSADILLWLGERALCPRHDAIIIGAQADQIRYTPGACDLSVSAMTGHGMDELRRILTMRAGGVLGTQSDYALHQRQRDGVGAIIGALEHAGQEEDILLIAEYLRLARVEMDRLTGRAGVEDVLDTVFGRFCIGK